MKKIKSVPVIFYAIVLISIIMSGCTEDNPIIPDGPYQFDSARYEWTTDTLYSEFTRKIFGLDSNHIYLSDNQSMFIYDGTNYSQHIINDMLFSEVGGIDPNNIYVSGSYFNGDYRLEKWNGAVYQNIPAPQNTGPGFGFSCIFVRDYNEIWLGASGKIFLYNGANFTEYNIDSGDVPIMIVENENRLLAVNNRAHCPDSTFTNCDKETVVYELINNVWVKVNSTFSFHNSTEFYPVKIGMSLFGNSHLGIFNFLDSKFTKFLNSPSPYLFNRVIGGSDINEFMTLGFDNVDQFYINWNGIKWSKEINDVSNIKDIKRISNNYYAIVENCFACTYVLFRKGKLK